MASLGNLWYEMGLDDGKFRERLEKDIALAKQANAELTALLTAQGKSGNTSGSRAAKEAVQYAKAAAIRAESEAKIAEMQKRNSETITAMNERNQKIIERTEAQQANAEARKRAADALEQQRKMRTLQIQQRMTQEAARAAAAQENHNRALLSTATIMSQLRTMATGYVSVLGAVHFVKRLAEVRGEFDMQLISLKALLQSEERATELYNRLQGLAVVSPFKFMDLTGFAKQLSAYQIPANELYDTTKRLADLSAGLGVDMNRIILAYGQVRSAAFLRGQELRQFTEAGLPMVQALADKFGLLENRVVSTGEVFDKISKREVPFEMVKEVIDDLTDEGGRFYQMQEKQSESLKGKISNLADQYELMLNRIGESNDGFLKGTVDMLVEIMQHSDDLLNAITALASGYGLVKTAVYLYNTTMTKQTATWLKNTMAAKANEAEMLRQQAVVRELNAVEKMKVATAKQLTTQNLMEAASKGMLTKSMALELVARRKITVEQARQMAATLGLTNAEIAQAAKSTILQRTWKGMQIAAARLGTTIKGLASSFAPMLAIGLVTDAIMTYYQRQEELASRIRETNESIKGSYAELAQYLKNNPLTLVNFEDDASVQKMLQKQVDEISNYPAIKDGLLIKAAGIEDTGKRVKYLQGELENLADTYANVAKFSDLFENANNDTGGFLEDNLADDLKDYAEALADYRNVMGGIKVTPDLWAQLRTAPAGYPDFAAQLQELNKVNASLDEYVRKWMQVPIYDRPELPQNMVNAVGDLWEAETALDNKFAEFQKNLAERLEVAGFDPANLDANGERMLLILASKFAEANSLTEDAAKELNKRLAIGFRLETPVWEEFGDRLNAGYRKLFQKMDLSKPMSDTGKKALDDLQKGMEHDFPQWREQIQAMFDDANLNLKIGVLVGNDVKPTTATQEWFDNQFAAKGPVPLSEVSRWNSLRPLAEENFKDYVARMQRERKDLEDEIAAMEKADNLTDTQLAQIRDKRAKIADYDRVLSAAGAPKEAKGRQSQSDPFVDRLNKRIDTIKSAIAEYEKLADTMGKAEARTKALDMFGLTADDGKYLNDGGEALLYSDVLDELGDRSTKQANASRTKWRKEQSKALSEDLYDSLKAAYEDAKRRISEDKEQFSLFDKAMEVTGDRGFSSRLAFGENVSFKNVTDKLRKELEEELKKKGSKLTVDEVLGLDKKSFNDMFGSEHTISALYDAINEETKKLKSDNANDLLDIIKNYRTFDEQLAEIENERNAKIGTVEASSLSPEQKDEKKQAINDEYDRKRSKLLFENFKKTSEWTTIFDDLDRVSTATIDGMIDKIQKFANEQELSVEETKSLIQAMRKLREESFERNPLKGIKDSIASIREARELLRRMDTNGADSYTIQKGDNLGYPAGTVVTRTEAENKESAGYSDLNNSTKGLIDKFDALSQATDLLGGLFDALGNSTLSDIGGVMGGALSGATQGMSIASTLFGQAAGPYGAAIGAAISGVTQILQIRTKRLQAQIDESARRAEALSDSFDRLGNAIDRYGGLTDRAANVTLSLFEQLERQAEASGSELNPIYRSMMQGFGNPDEYISSLRKQLNSLYNGKGLFSEKGQREQYRILEQLNALTSVGVGGTESLKAYQAQYAALVAQRAEVENQLRLEEDKGSSKDEDAIADYQSQLLDLNEQVRYFVEDLAKELYSIDFDNWAGQISDALTDAFANGENAVEAFKDTTNSIMKTVANSILKNLVISPMLDKLQTMLFGDENGNGGMFKTFEDIANNPGLVMETISEFFDTEGDAMVQAAENLLKGLDEASGGAISSTGENTGLSAGIQSITEDTADLLASYVNAIRADVAAIRRIQEASRDENDNGDLLANVSARLAEIASNTKRNADMAEEIRDTLRSVTTTGANGRKLKI